MSYIGANAQGIIASIDGGTISNATLDENGNLIVDWPTAPSEV